MINIILILIKKIIIIIVKATGLSEEEIKKALQNKNR